MVRGIFSSATGMEVQYRRINVLANNASNVNTPGYKSDDVTFSEFGQELVRRIGGGGSPAVGGMTDYVGLGARATDFSSGSYRQTGISTDLAIQGNGFFAVQGAGGVTEFTREGDFSVDAQGYLALPTGERLLDANNQPIRTGTDKISVSADGTVSTAAGAAGRIALYAAPAGGAAVKRADGFYDIAGAAPAGTGAVLEGWLEASNADMVSTMSGMMEATRAFQGCQQAFEVSDDMYDKLAQVGSLK